MSDERLADALRVLMEYDGGPTVSASSIREGMAEDLKHQARRAAYLECAEIAERDAQKEAVLAVGCDPPHSNEYEAAASTLRALAARYRQMAEGSGG